MPANEERSISLGQLQERPMKEPTSDTEGRYGDGAARTKVRRPKPKALLYHVCSNRIELLFQNGEHKVALVRSAIKQVAKSPSATISRTLEPLVMDPNSLAGLEELRKDLYVRREGADEVGLWPHYQPSLLRDRSGTELCCLLGPDGGTGIFGGKKAASFSVV
ncbi:hypothetical protein Tco_1330668 [Tanacetum coccineum]